MNTGRARGVKRGPPDANIRHPPYFVDMDVDAGSHCWDDSYTYRLYETQGKLDRSGMPRLQQREAGMTSCQSLSHRRRLTTKEAYLPGLPWITSPEVTQYDSRRLFLAGQLDLGPGLGISRAATGPGCPAIYSSSRHGEDGICPSVRGSPLSRSRVRKL
jgi:hypothetical protein